MSASLLRLTAHRNHGIHKLGSRSLATLRSSSSTAAARVTAASSLQQLSRRAAAAPPARRLAPFTMSVRTLKASAQATVNPQDADTSSGNHYTQPAENLSHDVTNAEKQHYDKSVAANKEAQIRRPWIREGADAPPVKRMRKAGAVTRGKLLTTPSRMLKLIIPLTTADFNSDRKDVEPLALLVHPQQPLSYLERLIQSELPLFEDKSGKERAPQVWFRAEEAMRDEEDVPESEAEAREEEKKEDEEKGKREDEVNEKKDDKNKKADEKLAKDEKSSKKDEKKKKEEQHEEDLEGGEVMIIDGKPVKTGKLNASKSKDDKGASDEYKKDRLGTSDAKGDTSPDGKPSVQSSPPKDAHERDDSGMPNNFVRWSSSTEIGDFIRDAARTRFFALEIESNPHTILVGVPSFHDRTHYLRMRLRQKSREIDSMADIKQTCDSIAERGAKRVALAGGAALVGYWWIVYLLTFRSELGWDVMEPVTYLVGLSSLIGGYAWFLFHNRQISYRSAMNFTISRRQSKLYEQHGFDIRRWEELVDEGNKLRREIKAVSEEYDVRWNEKEDAASDKVVEELKKEREKKKEKEKGKEEEGGDD